MNKVKIIYYGLIRNMPSSQEEEIALSGEATVKDLLHLLVERHGDEFRASILTSDWQLQPTTIIQLSGCNISEIDGINTNLEDNAELSITAMSYMISGG